MVRREEGKERGTECEGGVGSQRHRCHASRHLCRIQESTHLSRHLRGPWRGSLLWSLFCASLLKELPSRRGKPLAQTKKEKRRGHAHPRPQGRPQGRHPVRSRTDIEHGMEILNITMRRSPEKRVTNLPLKENGQCMITKSGLDESGDTVTPCDAFISSKDQHKAQLICRLPPNTTMGLFRSVRALEFESVAWTSCVGCRLLRQTFFCSQKVSSVLPKKTQQLKSH